MVFMAAAGAFMGAEDSMVGAAFMEEDFAAEVSMEAVSMAVLREWAADVLSAPGPASPILFQGPPSGAAEHTHIADIPVAVEA